MELHIERAERIADQFTNEYERYLSERGIRDDPRFRRIWTAAFTYGYEVGVRWIPAEETPRANGFYLITTEQEHTRAGRTRVGFYRDGKWLWFVEDGVLDVYGVIAWQPLPEPFQESTVAINLAKVKPSFGLGLTLKRFAKFLVDLRSVDAAFEDGRTLRMSKSGDDWIVEWEDWSHKTKSLMLAFRWLVARKGQKRRMAVEESEN